MKKACAKKILCGILSVTMLMSLSVSAMAAVSATSGIVYNLGEGTYEITTTVAGLGEGEMATYLLYDGSVENLAALTTSDIIHVDQRTDNGVFTYSGTGVFTGKIKVGAQSLSTPIDANPEELPVLEGVEAEIKHLDGRYEFTYADAAKVTDIKLNGTSVNFYVAGTKVGFFSADLGSDTTVTVTVDNAAVAGEVAVEIGTVKISEDGTSLTVFGRAVGAYSEAGIDIDGTKFAAMAVSGADGTKSLKGSFAIELIDETGDHIEDNFGGSEVCVYADDVTSSSKTVE